MEAMGKTIKAPGTSPGLRDIIDNLLHAVIGPIVSIVLFFMMCLTFVDVVGRYIFNSPVFGGLELTEFSMAIVIFLGLTLLCCEEKHVVVDIFDNFVPEGIKKIQTVTVNIVNFIVMGVISWQLWIKAGEAMEYGDRTQFLSLPMGPLMYFMSIMTGISSVIMLLIMVNSIKTPDKTPDKTMKS